MERKLYNIIKDIRKPTGKSFTNLLAVIGECGMVDRGMHTGCTSGMSCLKNGYVPKYVMSGQCTRGKSFVKDEIGRFFLEWLVKRSPYSSIFVSKNIDKIIETEWLVCRTDVPDNLLVGGLIANRVLWEYTTITECMYELVKRGVNENLAFLAAHTCLLTVDGRIDFSAMGHSHKAIDVSLLDKEYMSNFINGKMSAPRGDYKDTRTYMNIHRLWGSGIKDQSLNLITLAKKISAKKSKVCNNPFAHRLKTENETFEKEDGLNKLADLCNEIIKELQ